MAICPRCRATLLACARRADKPCGAAKELLATWVISLAPRPARRPGQRLTSEEAQAIAVMVGYRLLLTHHHFEPVQTLSDSGDVNAYLSQSMTYKLIDRINGLRDSEPLPSELPSANPPPDLDEALALAHAYTRWMKQANDLDRTIVRLWWEGFTRGPELTQKQIADTVRLHQTTVSRKLNEFKAYMRKQGLQ